MPTNLHYPTTHRDETVVDNFHGTQVPDPYRWLEDPDSSETQAWVQDQNQVTETYLSHECGDVRTRIHSKISEIFDYPKYSVPFQIGEGDFLRYYFFKNDGLQNQSVLYSQQTVDEEATVFLDPNMLSADGTHSIGAYDFSEDGKWFAYGISKSGSDWMKIYIRSVETGQDIEGEVLDWVKFSDISWTHDNLGFFYCRYDKPASFENGGGDAMLKSAGSEVDTNVYQKVYYHRIGTQQEQDVLILEDRDHPKWMFGPKVSDDGKGLVMSVMEGCDPVNRLWFVDLQQQSLTSGPLTFQRLVDNFDAEYSYITNDGSVYYLRTNLNSPNYKVIKTDLSQPNHLQWIDVIPQGQDVLKNVQCVNEDQLIVHYSHDVHSVLYLYNLRGDLLQQLELPDVGSVDSIWGRKQSKEIFYRFVSFVRAGTIFRYDCLNQVMNLFREVEVKGHDPSLFKTEQVFFESKDGTRVPMFIVSKKDHVRTGSSPTLLYGYGGFNISLPPSFSVSRLMFLTHFNGIFALPNIRGGGEYGDEWHKAGTRERKQNVFDDFQCAAEFLCREKYTNPSRIAIMGGSNGGLLVGACLNQRPDLFACGVAQVGVLDMLRFHKFTIGHAWCTDYGCSDNKEDFEFLIKYSPYHNINPDARYPAVLLATADHDDRVVPLHSFKYIAALQYARAHKPDQKGYPLLIRIDTKAGHGGGKPTSKVIEEWADTYAFIVTSIKATWTD